MKRLGPKARNVACNTDAYRTKRRAWSNAKARKRYVRRQRGVQPLRSPRPPLRRPITELVISGESRIERCLREAKEAVRRARRYGSGIPPASAYGTSAHADRRRYDVAVHEEFHRRLKTAGIPVEGA